MRLILVGILLLGVDYVLTDSSRSSTGDILERWLAERVVATAEIKVSAQSDERVHVAFKRAQAAQPAESTLTLVESNERGRKYQVQLMAPKRDQALTREAASESRLAAARTGSTRGWGLALLALTASSTGADRGFIPIFGNVTVGG